MARATADELLEAQRIQHAFGRQPTTIVAALVGVLIVFVVLMGVFKENVLQAWAAFMLSSLMLRAWIWHAFRSAAPVIDTLKRWEYAAAAAAFLSGLGWAALNGPLYPGMENHNARDYIIVISVVITLAAAAFSTLSHIIFICIVAPIIIALGLRLGLEASGTLNLPLFGVSALIALVFSIHRMQHKTVLETLRSKGESELLLAEQNAIFQSATVGILVLEKGLVAKCNPRLGELLGCRLDELIGSGASAHFVSQDELGKLIQESESAFRHGHDYHGMHRLHRADGQEFWAELSASAMRDGLEGNRSVWMISDASASERNRSAAQQD